MLPPLPGPHKGLRIGLFGGSFNPAHDGHLHVAETARRRLSLDWVWWIVARGNPLKPENGDFAQRLASAEAIANTHRRMIVTEIEAELGLTYTCETLETLQKRAPEAHFVWIMGGDNLASFHLWKNWQDIANRVPIAVVARPGDGASVYTSPFAQAFAAARLPETRAGALPHSAPPAWAYLNAPLNMSSSTAIRAQT